MLAKALLPLLCPLAVVVIQYLRARHNWAWDHISILRMGDEAALRFKEGKLIAVDAILGSAQTTFLVYVITWIPELFKAWQHYPTLTVLTVFSVFVLLDFSRRRTPFQN
jgi:hypothetical protein